MTNGEGTACAPLRRSVCAAALAGILLLAACVCALLHINALSLRGVVPADAYSRQEQVCLLRGGESSAPEGERGVLLMMDAPFVREGALHLTGALMHPGTVPGEVRLRVGIRRRGDENGAIALLNTQMVRRYELAARFGCDDHCGFHAAVPLKALRGGETGCEYDVVLLDDAQGDGKLYETGCSVAPAQGDAGVDVYWAEEGMRRE